MIKKLRNFKPRILKCLQEILLQGLKFVSDYVWLQVAAPPDPAFPFERTDVNHVGFQSIGEFSILRQI